MNSTMIDPVLDQLTTPSKTAERGVAAAAGSSIKAAPADHAHALGTNDRASLDASLGGGALASGRLKLATGPTANDTVTVGGHAFKFVTALGAADTFTQVLNGTAANARAWLIKAINGTVDAVHVTPATAPFAGLVVADEIDTDKVRVRSAATRGGTPAGSRTSVAVSEGLTAAADVWDVANLNETGQPAAAAKGTSSITITAAMVTRAKAYVDFPFTPVAFIASVLTSAGVPREITTDSFVIEGSAVKISLAGTGAPALQAGDVVTVQATA